MNPTVRLLGCELLHVSLSDDPPVEPEYAEHDNTSGQYELGFSAAQPAQPDDRR